jgi:hypothetical protein
MKRKCSTKILPRKFEPAVPGNVKLKLPTVDLLSYWRDFDGRVSDTNRLCCWAWFLPRKIENVIKGFTTLAYFQNFFWKWELSWQSHRLTKYRIGECFNYVLIEYMQDPVTANSHALSSRLKYSLELSSGWLEICMRVFSTLMPRSNENKSCMRVSEYSHQLSLNFEPVQSWWSECMRVDRWNHASWPLAANANES